MTSKYSALNYKKPTWADFLLCGVILSCACAIMLLFKPSEQGLLTATLRSNGNVVLELPLPTLQDNYLYSVPDMDYPLELEFTTTGVRVLCAECPGQDCVKQGHITTAGQQLICLPNRFTVSLSGGSSSGPDYVIG